MKNVDFYSVTKLLYTFLFVLIITKIIQKWYREREYPPGPIGIPVIGYALFLGKKPLEKLADLSTKYGDIYSFYVGPKLNVCVNDYTLAKELLNNPNLLHRPVEFSSFLTGRGGIAGMNGEEWQEQRRFTFYTMRNLGLGKGLWETMIQEAMAEFTEELKSLKGQPKNLEDVLGSFHASNIMSLLLGRHLDKNKDAEEIQIIHETTKALLKYFGQASMVAIFPWLRKFMEVFRLGGYHKFIKHLRKFEDIFIKEVEKRLQSPESLERDDYINCFIKEMKKRETTTESHTFTMENLLGNLIVLFISSHDSTMANITWLLLYMAAFPDIQKKVHDEIDSVVGRDGIVYFDDKSKFPYTMAIVLETLRYASIASVSPPRKILEDMTIRGYNVPKNSFLVINLAFVMHDPKYFKDPMRFKPDRFLTENDKVVKSFDGFIPFSMGKRNCPGEGIAIMTAFLYFASFMQKFRIEAPPGKKVDLEPISGMGNVPKPQELCFLER